MLYLLVYLFLIVFVVVFLYRGKVDVDWYLVYGRGGGVFGVSMSLVALVFGASSVFGLAGWGYKFGWNALWWVLSGVIFLVFLSLFVDIIYSLRSYTIVDIIAEEFGREVKVISSVVLFLAWVAVLSGQIIAGGNVVSLFIGDRIISIILFVLVFAIYTFVWGQVAIIKTSFLQVLLMVFGLLVLIYVLLSKNTLFSYELLKSSKFGFDENFSLPFWISLFISVGLSYFFGPDVYSRIFSSKDEEVARKSLLLSSLIIIVIAILIVAIGIISRVSLGSVDNPENIIPLLFLKITPDELKPLIFVSLVSIPLSGADAILITSTAILVRNIFGEVKPIVYKNNVWLFRLSVVFVIILSSLIALYGKSIMNVLFTSYKVFSSVIVPIIFVSILSKKGFLNLNVSNVGKVIMILTLLFSSFYILLAEVFIPILKFEGYSIYLLFFNFVVILLFSRV